MRTFNAKDYLSQKTQAINDFFRTNGLDSVVVGVSGGVDSAVVLLLYLYASRESDSPIRQVRALLMPIHGDGTSDQVGASKRGLDLFKNPLCDTEVFVWRSLELHAAYERMVAMAKVEEYGNFKQGEDPDHFLPSAWANGQMASVLRTPMFYYQAAIMQQQGFRSVVSGTTNRDEGSFIGFYGKASDGMVDIQPIADLHKSEVYKLAALLGVSESIVSTPPKGDVWDRRTDEEMIGAPYPFLQEYLEQRCLPDFESWRDLVLTSKSKNAEYLVNIEKLHDTNKHKYMVGSPAHFIDVLDRKVPGGWS